MERKMINVHTLYIQRLDELTRKKNENALLGRQIEDNEKRMLRVIEQLEIGQEALSFLEKVANSRRGSMKAKIESVLSEALQLLYGKSYRVEMNYTVKRNRSDMTIEVIRDTPNGEVRREPTDGTGGGVADSVTVPLRLMVLLGAKQTDKIAVLDECYKHMDNERIELVGEFLKVLAERLEMQIIMCSHHIPLQDKADMTYHVSDENGVAKVTEC
jgi:DNA repair exonuclease SbcCD ATPase subunit